MPKLQTIDSLLDEKLSDMRIVQSLKVPGYPKRVTKSVPRDEIKTFLENWSPNFLGQVILEDGSLFAYCNKLNPHAQFDNMLIQTDRNVRSSISSLSLSQAKFALKRAGDFVDYVSASDVANEFQLWNGSLHLVYNTDPQTLDRESGMGYTKRYHIHMNYWKEEQISAGQVELFSNIRNIYRRRRLVDPLTPLSGRIINEICMRENLFSKHTILLQDSGRDAEMAFPPGFKMKLRFGWNTLKDIDFVHDIRLLHEHITETFDDLRESFLGSRAPSPMWVRPPLLPLQNIEARLNELNFSKYIRTELLHLAEILHSPSSKLLTRWKTHKHTRIAHMPMNGPCYSTGFYSPTANTLASPINVSQDVYLVIQVKLFADVGGAGLIYNKDASVIELARGSREFSEHEQSARSVFQNEFIKFQSGIE